MRQAKEESQVKLKKKKVIDQSVCGRIRISYCGQLGINHNGYCGRPCIACLTVSEMKDKEVEIRSLFTKSSSVISYGLPPRSINCLLLLVACCLYTVGIPPKPKKKKKKFLAREFQMLKILASTMCRGVLWGGGWSQMASAVGGSKGKDLREIKEEKTFHMIYTEVCTWRWRCSK